MARKSADFNVVFHLPDSEEGKQLLSRTIGELHMKLINELIDEKISDIDTKNQIIIEVMERLRGSSHG